MGVFFCIYYMHLTISVHIRANLGINTFKDLNLNLFKYTSRQI